MEAAHSSSHRTARLAAVLYVFIILLAIYSGEASGDVVVPGDPAATAKNLLDNELLFRSATVAHLASVIAFTVMTFMLYRVFRQANRHLSRLMVAPVLIQVPIFLVLEVFHITALVIVKDNQLTSFTDIQKQELAYLFMRMFSMGIAASQIFWGLFMLPFGIVAFRSGYLPKIFGILLLLNGVGYVVEGCAYLLLQRDAFLLVRGIDRFTFIGLPLTMLWILVKGVAVAGRAAGDSVKPQH
jgi:Domain of unknown function (DUF4386)